MKKPHDPTGARALTPQHAEHEQTRDMLRELMNDNKAMAHAMREAHEVCEDGDDTATASLLEQYIDETERRTWFLFESSRAADANAPVSRA